MTPDDSFQAVLLAKALRDIWTELEADTSFRRTSTRRCLRIRPQHLHHQSRLAWLSLAVSVEFSDILEGGFIVREEATVQDEVLIAY